MELCEERTKTNYNFSSTDSDQSIPGLLSKLRISLGCKQSKLTHRRELKAPKIPFNADIKDFRKRFQQLSDPEDVQEQVLQKHRYKLFLHLYRLLVKLEPDQTKCQTYLTFCYHLYGPKDPRKMRVQETLRYQKDLTDRLIGLSQSLLDLNKLNLGNKTAMKPARSIRSSPIPIGIVKMGFSLVEHQTSSFRGDLRCLLWELAAKELSESQECEDFEECSIIDLKTMKKLTRIEDYEPEIIYVVDWENPTESYQYLTEQSFSYAPPNREMFDNEFIYVEVDNSENGYIYEEPLRPEVINKSQQTEFQYQLTDRSVQTIRNISCLDAATNTDKVLVDISTNTDEILYDQQETKADIQQNNSITSISQQLDDLLNFDLNLVAVPNKLHCQFNQPIIKSSLDSNQSTNCQDPKPPSGDFKPPFDPWWYQQQQFTTPAQEIEQSVIQQTSRLNNSTVQYQENICETVEEIQATKSNEIIMQSKPVPETIPTRLTASNQLTHDWQSQSNRPLNDYKSIYTKVSPQFDQSTREKEYEEIAPTRWQSERYDEDKSREMRSEFNQLNLEDNLYRQRIKEEGEDYSFYMDRNRNDSEPTWWQTQLVIELASEEMSSDIDKNERFTIQREINLSAVPPSIPREPTRWQHQRQTIDETEETLSQIDKLTTGQPKANSSAVPSSIPREPTRWQHQRQTIDESEEILSQIDKLTTGQLKANSSAVPPSIHREPTRWQHQCNIFDESEEILSQIDKLTTGQLKPNSSAVPPSTPREPTRCQHQRHIIAATEIDKLTTGQSIANSSAVPPSIHREPTRWQHQRQTIDESEEIFSQIHKLTTGQPKPNSSAVPQSIPREPTRWQHQRQTIDESEEFLSQIDKWTTSELKPNSSAVPPSIHREPTRWQHQRHIIAASRFIINQFHCNPAYQCPAREKDAPSFNEQMTQLEEIVGQNNSIINVATIRRRFWHFQSNTSCSPAELAKFQLKQLLTTDEQREFESLRYQQRDRGWGSQLNTEQRLQDALHGMLGNECQQLCCSASASATRCPRLILRCPQHQQNISESFLLLALAQLGYFYRRLQQQQQQQLQQLGDCGRALKPCLLAELRRYALFYEQQKSQPESLIQLYLKTRVYLHRFQWLLQLCSGLSRRRTLLQRLQLQLNEDSRLNLWLQCATEPLLAPIANWLLCGTLPPNDKHLDFFIVACGTQRIEVYWTQQFALLAAQLPHFLPQPVARQLLAAGRNQNYARRFLGRQLRCRLKGHQLQLRLSVACGCAYRDCDLLPLEQLINGLRLDTSRQLLEQLHQLRPQPLELFSRLQQYLLLADVEFVRELIELLEPALEQPAACYCPQQLNSMLEQLQGAHNRQLHVVRSLDSHCDRSWSCFLLRWQLPSHWLALLGPRLLQYDSCFGCLWQLHYADYVLNERIRRQQSHFRERSNLEQLHVRHVRDRFELFIDRLQQFMHHLRSYALEDVLASAYEDFYFASKSAGTLDELLELHENYLGRIERGLLKAKPKSELAQLYELIFQLDIEHHKFLSLSQLSLQELELRWVCQNTCDAISDLELIFHLALGSFLRQLNGTRQEQLMQLASNLDENGYYEKCCRKLSPLKGTKNKCG